MCSEGGGGDDDDNDDDDDDDDSIYKIFAHARALGSLLSGKGTAALQAAEPARRPLPWVNY
ncbi:hypothetical protein E2C01_032682 [Portunus trituberculatus]|uniref:Uncharacterized protein n=1 Tax=Portunus trituberculatus TaxID=210409 RepID=A0A5B7F1P9_PORTR|nr:hypothetical protein [Portunus trituberculatus]